MSVSKSVLLDDDKNVEKVYVDWPEENDSERYRFVSSRIDNHEIDEFEYVDEIPHKEPFQDDRYEDLAEPGNKSDSNNVGIQASEMIESIPPLELISQTSSLELPGTKGEIDIDLRSNSDESILTVQDSLNLTHLPNVSKEDLVLNYSEYDSVKRDIYDLQQTSSQNEAAIYANAQQKMHNIRQTPGNKKPESGSSSLKHGLLPIQTVPKSKPTLSVAPQRNNNLQNRNKALPSSQSGNAPSTAPNFIELNKTRAFMRPKENLHLVTTESYSAKFTSNRRPLSKNPDEIGQYEKKPLQKSSSMRSVKQNHFLDEYYHEELNFPENPPHPPNFHPDQPSYMNYHQYYSQKPNEHSYFYMQQTDNRHNHHPIHHVHTQPSLPTNYQHQHHPHQDILHSSPRIETVFHVDTKPDYSESFRRVNNQQTQLNQDPDPGQVKRQPTLYDNQLLSKKMQDVINNNSGIKFPPINSSGISHSNVTTASSTTKPDGSSYAEKFRSRAKSYDRYTLRDYKNIRNIEPVGGLGPNIGSSEHQKMKEKLLRQQIYAQTVKDRNKHEIQQQKSQSSNHKKNEENDETKKENEQIESEEESQSIRSQLDEDAIKSSANKNRDSQSQSVVYSAKSSANKREVMLNYAKSVRMKQNRKINNKTTQDSNSDTSQNSTSYEKYFNNNDLEKLLQRHEADKKIANQIQEKLGKIQ